MTPHAVSSSNVEVVDDKTSRFLISIIVATYNVEKYIPAFLRSLDDQTADMVDVQLIFVNDGSPDRSGDLIRDWSRGRGDGVVVMTKENGGAASARNAGLGAVDAEWVTFADPDDVLDRDYLREVVKFIRLHGQGSLAVLATHILMLNDSTGEVTNTHPLRSKFDKGSRVVDLRAEPLIQISGGSTFVRTSVLRQEGITFDERIRPNFEDGHLISRVLLSQETPRVGIVASAKYHYRYRADGSSLVQSSHDKATKYTDLLRYGFLDLIERATNAGGAVPRWLENVVLYDLLWYFKNEMAIRSLTAAAPASTFDEFHELIRRIIGRVSRDAVRSFDFMSVDFVVREAVLRGYEDSHQEPEYVRVFAVDESRQEIHLTYFFTGEQPEEVVLVDGEVTEPLFGKTQDYRFYGRVLLRRRHLWIRRGLSTTMTLGGRPVPFTRGEQWGHQERLTHRQINPLIMSQRKRVKPQYADPSESLRRRAGIKVREWREGLSRNFSRDKMVDNALAITLHMKKTREKFADAWVFMDRNTDANDNAEHLYRHVRAHHPEINAWFVLEKDSPDWARLENEGFRLVAYRSWEWHHLIFSAAHLASSHIDQYVIRPLLNARYGWPRFHYTFLQHGITKDDLSRWLNVKPIDLLVTATPQEHDSIALDGPYAFSGKEVVMTGFPRHDALLRLRRATPDEDRSLIVIMPTWRQVLLGPALPGSNKRTKGVLFPGSDYAKQYGELLQSNRLKEIAERGGKSIVFMPHPNMAPHLEDFDIPPHVTLMTFHENNVQEVLARSALLITDYSSLGFEAAFLDIPLVYFQFDAAEFFNGMHIGRRGYFDYARDGFGPVAETVDDVTRAVDTIGALGFSMEAEYAARTQATFTQRDDQNSERVVTAMKALDGGPRLATESKPVGRSSFDPVTVEDAH